MKESSVDLGWCKQDTDVFPHKIFVSYEGKVETLLYRSQVTEAKIFSGETADNF